MNASIIICNPDYIPESYQTALIFVTLHPSPSDGASFWAIFPFGVIVNIFDIKLMHGVDIGAMIVHGCGAIVVIVVLSVTLPSRSPPSSG